MDTASRPGTREQVVGGRYAFDPSEVLGSGGLAIVYRGRDLRTRQEVAIKSLRAEFLAVPDLRRRFREEARLMRFARHPNLVQIRDHIDLATGSWIVMELVPGRNLKDTVEADGPLELTGVARILQQIARALDFLHERDAIHLDLKPQNIVLTPEDGAKLIDFGLAQAHGPKQETIDGNPFGTAAYLSPEQAKAEPVDRRTDVYALGCVVYELLTGRPPFVVPEGPNQKGDLIAKHLRTVPAPPSTYRSEIPPWLDAAVLRAIAKSPIQRYQTAGEFAQQVLDGFRGKPRAMPETRPTGTGVGPPVREPGNEPGRAGPSPLRQIWARGGKAAKRTRPIHGRIWRIALVFAIGNLLLGMVLQSREGMNGVLGPVLGFVPGGSTTVSTDMLNLRESPGSDSPVLAVLGQGTEVQITGWSRVDGDERWWPIDVDYQDRTISGWVWSDGIAPTWFTQTTSFPSRMWQRATSA
ncbi:MAG TPA: serine/threonine protein kinase, partial [Thermomicrobiales bacterium]|nr:serine/threonine protein kinase [Thermomicrobiales bacterium]